MNAMEAYRAAERVYRVLYWGTPKKLAWTFLALIEIVQTTGQWPDANQLAEAACIDLQTVEKHLKKLDLMDLSAREQTICFSNNTFTAGNSGFVSEIVGLVLEDHCPKLPLQTQVPLYGLTLKFMTSSTELYCNWILWSKKFNQAGMAGKPGGENPPASISGAGGMDRAGSIYQYQRWEIQIQEDFQLQSGACSRQFGVTSRQIDLEKGQNYLNKTTKNQYDTITPSRARNKYNININIIPLPPRKARLLPTQKMKESKRRFAQIPCSTVPLPLGMRPALTYSKNCREMILSCGSNQFRQQRLRPG